MSMCKHLCFIKSRRRKIRSLERFFSEHCDGFFLVCVLILLLFFASHTFVSTDEFSGVRAADEIITEMFVLGIGQSFNCFDRLLVCGCSYHWMQNFFWFDFFWRKVHSHLIQHLIFIWSWNTFYFDWYIYCIKILFLFDKCLQKNKFHEKHSIFTNKLKHYSKDMNETLTEWQFIDCVQTTEKKKKCRRVRFCSTHSQRERTTCWRQKLRIAYT